jgi:hypothetical protein
MMVNYHYVDGKLIFLTGGRSLRCVAFEQVESVEGTRANVLTADGGHVVVALKQTAVDTQFVEFEGVVDAPNQLREVDRAYFGNSFGQ